MTELFTWLAQVVPTSQPVPTGLEAFLKNPFLPILLIVGVFLWISARGRTKERRRYEDMLNSLKKNDRVLTIGGLIGTVVDVRDTEVVLKIDETNNVKVRFTRAAVKEVVREPAAPAESKS